MTKRKKKCPTAELYYASPPDTFASFSTPSLDGSVVSNKYKNKGKNDIQQNFVKLTKQRRTQFECVRAPCCPCCSSYEEALLHTCKIAGELLLNFAQRLAWFGQWYVL